MSVSSYAASMSVKVDIPRDIVINGTLVKKGTYKINYDEVMGELVIRSGDKLILRAPARAEFRQNRSGRTELVVIKDEATSRLRRITLAGEERSLIVDTRIENVAPQQ